MNTDASEGISMISAPTECGPMSEIMPAAEHIDRKLPPIDCKPPHQFDEAINREPEPVYRR
jgi:hypothetical protein